MRTIEEYIEWIEKLNYEYKTHGTRWNCENTFHLGWKCTEPDLWKTMNKSRHPCFECTEVD